MTTETSSVYQTYWDPENNKRHGSYAGGKDVIVRARDVKKIYRMDLPESEWVHALRGITMEIYKGEYLAIMGPSGSGKSTFFNAIGGLDQPTSGQVFIDEVDIAQLDASELAWMRCRKIGYIFQSYNLITVMTAIENIMLPMTFAGTLPMKHEPKPLTYASWLASTTVLTISHRNYPVVSNNGGYCALVGQ